MPHSYFSHSRLFVVPSEADTKIRLAAASDKVNKVPISKTTLTAKYYLEAPAQSSLSTSLKKQKFEEGSRILYQSDGKH